MNGKNGSVNLEAFLAGTADGVSAVDSDGVIVAWNAAAERILGHRANEVVGRLCGDVLDARDAAGNLACSEFCTVRNHAKRCEPVHHFKLKTKDECRRSHLVGRQWCDARVGTGRLCFMDSSVPGLDGVPRDREQRRGEDDDIAASGQSAVPGEVDASRAPDPLVHERRRRHRNDRGPPLHQPLHRTKPYPEHIQEARRPQLLGSGRRREPLRPVSSRETCRLSAIRDGGTSSR